MKVIKPIIIVGTGRCGSTLFHRLLANHPQLMWLSGFAYRYPAQAEVEPLGGDGDGQPAPPPTVR